MDNAKIDYNTANIVFPINTPNGEIKVFIPPVNKEEVKSNALVLGNFAGYIDNINPAVLLTDYDVYIDEVIEKLANKKYNSNDPRYKKYINDSKFKITAMLERSIAAGYYFEYNDVKPLNSINGEAKDIIKASLLFFIVILRYIKPQLTLEEWEEKIKALSLTFTSSTVTEWKNTFMTTITNPRDFRGIGLHIYKNGNIERIPIENSIADFLFRFPFDYFKDYVDMYFSDEVKKDLKEEGIKNYNSLINYLKKVFKEY